MPKNTSLRIIDEKRTTGAAFVGGGSGGGAGVTDHGLLSGLTDDDHPQYHTDERGDLRYVPLARTVTAGNGLTGGGALSANISLALASSAAGAGLAFSAGVLSVNPGEGLEIETDNIGLASSVAGDGLTYAAGVLNVGAGTLITVAADAVGLSSGSPYQMLVTNVSGTPFYRDILTVAGAGLTADIGIMAVGAGSGITVNANDVALTTPGTLSVSSANAAAGNHTHAVTASAAPGAASALLKTDATGLLTLAQLAIGAAATYYSTNNVDAGPDIQFVTNALIAAADSLYLNADSTNSGAGAIVFSKGDSKRVGGGSSAVELARITNAGRLGIGNNGPSYELDVTGTARATVALRTADVIATANVRTPSVDTASGQLTLAPANNITEAIGRLRTPRLDTNTGQDMTISPDGDLYLSPVGNDVVVAQAAAFRSDNFLKTVLTAGFRIGPTTVSGQSAVQAGSAEFDELRVRVFVADETRVDRGQWYLTKSYAILSRAFTTPASIGGTADFYVENSPLIAGALFSNNDWVMFGYLDMSTGIVLTKVWGQVSGYTTAGLTGEQKWTFTLRQGTGGYSFPKGAATFDFGGPTSGYFVLADTVTATSPYIQVGKWTTNPYTPANYSVLTQMGRLDGAGFTGEYGLAAAVGAYGTDDPWIKVSTAGAQLNNLPLVLTNGGATKVYIGAWNNVWMGPSSSDKRLSWDGSTLAIVGTVTANAGAIANWGIGIIDANTISSNNIRLISGASAVARLEVGASGEDYAGILARSTGTTAVFWAGKSYSTLISSPATVPFRVNLNGDLFASNATIVGNVTATTGYIGTAAAGWAISSDRIVANGIRLVSAANDAAFSSRMELGDYDATGSTQLAIIGLRGVPAGTVATNTVALWAGRNYFNRASAPFRVTYGGNLIATSATISGTVTATAGAIGGWTLSAGQISSANIRLISSATTGARLETGSSGANYAGVAAGANNYDVVMWAGDAWADLDGNTPFRVTLAGQMFSTSATFGTPSGARVNVDGTGMYIPAPATWDLSYGYKFAYGDVLTSGLTLNARSLALWNNTTNDGVEAVTANVNTGTYIKNVATGDSINSTIELNAYQISGGRTAGLQLQATNTTRRAVFSVDTADGLRVTNFKVWHEGNTGSGSTLVAGDSGKLNGQTAAYYATASALSSYAPLASPAFTGTPTADTFQINNNTGSTGRRYIDIGRWRNVTNYTDGDSIGIPAAKYVRLFVYEDPTGKLRLAISWPGATRSVSDIIAQP